MIVSPAGKTRLMEAQTISSPLAQGFKDNDLPLLEQKSVKEESPSVNPVSPGSNTINDNNDNAADFHSSEKKNTLTNYVYKKLQGYGYPGRRLEQFKNKFVRESLTPDGTKDVQIELPDKKYSDQGIAESIDHEELKEIAHEINKNFGLNFNGAEHNDGKWTIKFTSQKITNPEEQSSFKDNLEEVYGNPAGKGKEKKVKAYTLREMINAQKNATINKLKTILGK